MGRLPVSIEIQDGGQDSIVSALERIDMSVVAATHGVHGKMTLVFEQTQKESPVEAPTKHLHDLQIGRLDGVVAGERL